MIRKTLLASLLACVLVAPGLLTTGCSPEEAADSLMVPAAEVASSTVDSLNESIEQRSGDYAD